MKNSNDIKLIREIIATERRLLKCNKKFCETDFRNNLHEIIRITGFKELNPEIVLVTSENMWVNVKLYKGKSYIIVDTTYLEALLRLNNLYYVENHKALHTKTLLLEIISKIFISHGDPFLAGALCKYHHAVYDEYTHFLTDRNHNTKIQDSISITFVICHELAHVLYKSKCNVDRVKICAEILSQLKEIYSLLESNRSKISQESHEEFLLNNAKVIFPSIDGFDKSSKEQIIDYYTAQSEINYDLISESRFDNDPAFLEECYCDRIAIDFMLKLNEPKNQNGMIFIFIYILNTIYNIQNLILLKTFVSNYQKKDFKKHLSLTLKTVFRKELVERYVIEKFAKSYAKETESFKNKVRYLSDMHAEQADVTEKFIIYSVRNYCDDTLNNSDENKPRHQAQLLYDLFEMYRSTSSIV